MEYLIAPIVLVSIMALVLITKAGSKITAITMACGHVQGFTSDEKPTEEEKDMVSHRLCDNCASKSEGERNTEDTVLMLIAMGK